MMIMEMTTGSCKVFSSKSDIGIASTASDSTNTTNNNSTSNSASNTLNITASTATPEDSLVTDVESGSPTRENSQESSISSSSSSSSLQEENGKGDNNSVDCRATLAEKEVTSLKEQLANHGGTGGGTGGGSCSTGAATTMAPPPPEREDPLISPQSQHNKNDYEVVAAKDKEIASLVEDIQRLQSSLNQIRENSATQIRLLEEQLNQKQEVISRLEARLDQQRDYEEMKRELCNLKASNASTIITATNTDSPNSSINGVDAKDTKDNNIIINANTTTSNNTTTSVNSKRPASPGIAGIPPRFLLGPTSLPVEAFGSLLGEEIVATWRRSLERSLLASSPPSQPHGPTSGLTPSHHHLGVNESSSSPPVPPSVSSPHESSMADGSMDGGPHCNLNGSSGPTPDRIPFRYEDSLIPKSDPMEARLQEMLRYNMDKFGSQCLDTLQISRRVRELLSIHNIGQRLFAKYILGLSQGTVSELLSKPKPWDKLTEKGRDSYRKMHAWAADDASVMLLKSLIPKKGKEGSGGSLPSSFRSVCEDSGADDRIAHILSEANQALHRSHGLNNSIGNHDSLCDDNPGNKSPLSGNNNNLCNNNNNNTNNNNNLINNNGPSSPSGSSGRGGGDRRLRKYENDDIPQEQVARIYQEELAKLVGLSRLPHGMGGDPTQDPRIPREHFQSLLFPHLFGGSLLERDEIRMALDAYHRELAKLAATTSGGSPSHFPPPLFHPGAPGVPNGLGGAQDLTMPKRLSPLDTKDNDEKNEKDDASEMMRHVGSAFSLVRPKGGESNSGAPSPLNTILPPSGVDDTTNASPLQRMASITNSLISQVHPTAPSVASPSQRPLKAVLPPITQQQFDQYNNLNTEDIVRKVKEQLSQYSISQRLFGESVLGLSQGSVSDLLARPKPWHMLTQKGREPFIRMKMFLEDDNAVHKLVASQYKIAPEKLMRTGGYAGNPSPATASKAPSKIAELPKSQETSPLPPPPPPIPPMPPTSVALSQMNLETQIANCKKPPSSSHGGHGGATTPTPPLMHTRQPPSGLPPQPSVYEMAALTQDLDTQLITTKIKEALLANNIGQKIFGEMVLGLSQGSVSELLSKPKPWHMLSIKGREPFIRMQLWLADPLNVERLQHLKNERREANKRKRGLPHSNSSMDAYGSGTHGSSDNSNDSPNDSYSPGSSAAAPPSKKQRVLFSEEQKEALKLAFALDPYPNVSAIEFLARELGLSSRTITNWFHNHRMRLKQQTSSPVVQETPLSSQPFDPVQFRLMLHQRLLELHKDKFSALGFMGHHSGHGMEEGLDLSMSNTASRAHSDNEDDFFEEEDDDDVENEGSVASDDSGGSNSSRKKRKQQSKPLGLQSNHSSLQGKLGVGVSSSGSSRRKPVAPQWFNPSWHDDSDDEEVLINGVCVFQNPTPFGSSGKSSIKMEPSLPSKARLKLEPREESTGEKTDDDIDGADEPLSPSSNKNEDDKASEVSLKQSLKHLKHEPNDDAHDLSGDDDRRSDGATSE